jgi:hypothetical protein
VYWFLGHEFTVISAKCNGVLTLSEIQVLPVHPKSRSFQQKMSQIGGTDLGFVRSMSDADRQ